MIRVTSQAYPCGKIRRRIALETEGKNALRRRRGSRLEEKGRPLSEEFGLARAWTGNYRPTIRRAHGIKCIGLKFLDSDWLPLCSAYSS